MGMKDKTLRVAKRFKLTSHHAIERFGVLFGIFTVTGVLVIVGSGAAAFQADRDSLAHTALYTTEFETSKTALKGEVDGVFSNKAGDKALVMMHFSDGAQISYNAAEYQAFLLGSDSNLNSEAVTTGGIKASFHVFGSTGYVGVLLDAGRAFDRQVLNLTMRANAELSHDDKGRTTTSSQELPEDATFSKYDQWRVFFNPGATGTTKISALEALTFDPAQAYYDVVLKKQEQRTRDTLDEKLQTMRTDLAQIDAYTSDLQTTKVDGLFLRPPSIPAVIAGDKVTGVSASEAEDGVSTLALDSDHVVPGGFDINWRSGNVYEGYLDVLVPAGQSFVEFLAKKQEEESAEGMTQQVSDMEWTLSDGSNLKTDYQASDVAMRPLINVMNNLSQAYQNYARNKSEYQSDLTLELLGLDVDLRDVQSNGSIRDDKDFLTTLD